MNGQGGKARESTLPQRASLKYTLAAITESNTGVAQFLDHLICNKNTKKYSCNKNNNLDENSAFI